MNTRATLCLLVLGASLLLIAACGPVGGGPGGNCVTPQNLGDVNGEDRTLAAGTCYTTGGFQVRNATLTIEEGVEIAFSEDAVLNLTKTSDLIIEGTADAPVLLTGTEKERGWWGGIVKANTATSNVEISHATIEYGGGKNSDGNIHLLTCCGTSAELSMDNTTLRESETYGLWANKESLTIDDFADNTLTANTQGPLAIPAHHAGTIATSNDLTGRASPSSSTRTTRPTSAAAVSPATTRTTSPSGATSPAR